MTFANKVRLLSGFLSLGALLVVLLLSLRIFANAVGYAFDSIGSIETIAPMEVVTRLGDRISAVAEGGQREISNLTIGIISIFSHVMLAFCLLTYWMKQFSSTLSTLYESAKLAMIPDERDQIRFGPQPDIISVGRRLSSQEPYDYSVDIPRTTKILIGSKAPQVLPVFQTFFQNRQERVIAPLRAIRYLFVALFAFGIVSLILFWAGNTPKVIVDYWSSTTFIALASLLGMAFISGASSFLDNRLLRGLLANKLLGASAVGEKSSEPIPLRVSSLSLSKHLVDKLDDEPIFGNTRILIDNDEGRSKSVQDTGDFAVNIISEGPYTEEPNPLERLGKSRLLIGAAFSVLASVLLAFFSVPQVLSGMWNGEGISLGRVMLAPVVIAAAYAVATAISRTGESLQADGARILATDWISSEITFTEFYGQVSASTGRRLDQAGMIAEEEKGQVCQTNYRATSATVCFLSDVPGGLRYPYFYEVGDQSQPRLQAIATAIRKIAAYGQSPSAISGNPIDEPKLLLSVNEDNADHIEDNDEKGNEPSEQR